METDQKIQIAVVLVSAAFSVVASLAAVHGIYLLPLDGIGGTGH